MDPRDWKAPQWEAFGTVGALVVAVVVAWFVWVQVRHAKALREEQARPYVIVDFEFRRFLVQIAIKNIGATPARDVAITFDKPLQAASESRRDINESSVFARPIPMLAPGRTIRITFDSGIELFKREDLPLTYQTTVEYRDMSGKRFKDPPYPLDLSPYKHTPIEPKGIPELVQELEGLKKELGKWSRSGGLRVLATNEDLRHRREMPSFHVERARRAWAEAGTRGFVAWAWNELMLHYGWR